MHTQADGTCCSEAWQHLFQSPLIVLNANVKQRLDMFQTARACDVWEQVLQLILPRVITLSRLHWQRQLRTTHSPMRFKAQPGRTRNILKL
eukprot:106696-Amphidinium_carterae.1